MKLDIEPRAALDMRAIFDAVRALATEWATQGALHNPREIDQQIADGRAVIAILDGKEAERDGDTGTRAIVEEFRPAEVAWTYVDPIVQQAIKTATTSVKDGNGDSVYSRDNLADAIQLLVAAIQILDRPSDGEVTA